MPVQIEALRRSYNRGPKEKPRGGWGHFLEQGQGKTSLCLNEATCFFDDYGLKRGFILSPSKFVEGWQKDAEKFGYQGNIHLFDSNKRNACKRWLASKPVRPTLIVNYEALRSEQNMEIFEEFVDADTFVGADESIQLKNQGAVQHKHGVFLADRADVKRCLTGKPSVQGPHDYWGQLRFLGYQGMSFWGFRNRYCIMGGYLQKQVLGVKKDKIAELQHLLSQWSWSARKSDWWKGAPEKLYPPPRVLEMTPEQKKAYMDMWHTFVLELEGGDIITTDQIVAKNRKLDQIASGFIYDEHHGTHWLMPHSKNPILLDIKSVLEDEISGKLVVNAVHEAMIEMLIAELAKYQPAVIRGGNRENVEDEKLRFNGDPACRVIIGQEAVLKYGHTLIGTKDMPCHTIYFAENTYSLDDRSQVEDRPHRYGQHHDSVSYLDRVIAPIDKSKIRALQRKEDVASAIMGYLRETGILPHKL